MNERDFFYWLQGFFELSGAAELNRQQVKVIKEHMSLVAEKVTVSSVESLSESENKNAASCDEHAAQKSDVVFPFKSPLLPIPRDVNEPRVSVSVFSDPPSGRRIC